MGNTSSKNNKNIHSKSQSVEDLNNKSANSKTGYMERGNSGKIAAKQSTRNR